MGNIYAALLSWLSVKSQGGQWLLRIEDIHARLAVERREDAALQFVDHRRQDERDHPATKSISAAS